MNPSAKASIIGAHLRRNRLHPLEALPWLAATVVFFFFPQFLNLGAHVVVTIILVLSMDLLVGYAGIVTLGHAAFYGAGAYAAGILSVSAGINEPFTGLAVGTIVGALVGLLSGAMILRTRGLALLILSLALLLLLQEVANQAFAWTGGADGLAGMSVAPLFGTFSFGLDGKVIYLYSLGCLFVCWAFLRVLLVTPFGRSVVGIRENPVRMAAMGVNVGRRELAVFTVAAAMAGLAGALGAQIDQFVSLNMLSFELSGMILVILALGGVGRLYGAFIGTPLFFVAQDFLSKDNPVYWNFWLGLLLVVIVLFARGGILGTLERAFARVRPQPAASPRASEARP